jgi:hypothetical protein
MRFLPVNDGMFIISRQKGELMTVMRHAMILLAARFIATRLMQDRHLLRAAIAFGPVYTGEQLAPGIRKRKLRNTPELFANIFFGSPIIQAYKNESLAAPYGISIHESARAFANTPDTPFQMQHWIWWQDNAEARRVPKAPPLTDLKECLLEELLNYLNWMDKSLIFHGIGSDKILDWKTRCNQYFSLG